MPTCIRTYSTHANTSRNTWQNSAKVFATNFAISPVSRNIVHFHVTLFKTSEFLPHSFLFVSAHIFSKTKDFINSDSSPEASLVCMSLTVVLFWHFRTFDRYIYNIHPLSPTTSRSSEKSFVFIIPIPTSMF